MTILPDTLYRQLRFPLTGLFPERRAAPGGDEFPLFSPIDGAPLGGCRAATWADYDGCLQRAVADHLVWRSVPMPRRGEVLRQVTARIREHKDELAAVIQLEVGKTSEEARGEVQEIIDIGDFALGLARTLGGPGLQSERPCHRMFEQWHPLGVVGVITAFNFPMAVWGWNAMIGALCGNAVIWKPSERGVISAHALLSVCAPPLEVAGVPNLFSAVCTAGPEGGKWLALDPRIPLVSATGSTKMGRAVATTVGARLGRTILELGGNNAAIIAEDAPLDLAIPSILFGFAGTAGQRCTSTRRALVHRSIMPRFLDELVAGCAGLVVGDPREPTTQVGPLISTEAVARFETAVARAVAAGGRVRFGGTVRRELLSGLYVTPTVIEMPAQVDVVLEETFAPILYTVPFDSLDEAIELQNGVPQGLSSTIFTLNLRVAERFLSCAGSDCGIANVNLGTSGAEVGGAHGGEKETGGGRESGSDVWKQYMRRQTCTINFGTDAPLAQNVRFLQKR